MAAVVTSPPGGAVPDAPFSMPPEPAPRPLRHRPRQFTTQDAVLLAGSLAASFSFVWVVFYQLTFLAGASGYVICSFTLFLGLYYVANRHLSDHQAAVNRVVGAVVTACALGVVVALGLVVGWLGVKGFHLVSWSFLSKDQRGVTSTDPATAGGVSHAIVGTLEQVGLAVLIGGPAGVITAVFLSEIGGRFTSAVRTVVTAMSALPTIVAGLFIYALVVVKFGYGFRGFAGSLALAIMLLPNVTRTTEEVLRVVHGSLREASMALGAPAWRTVWSVVLPTARTGIITAMLLGIARIVGEAAPLIVTIFGNDVFNSNPFSGPQEALPLFIFDYRGLSVAADVERAFSAGLVLVGLVAVLFILARVLGSMKPGAIGHFLRRDRTNKELS
ncbi:MAG: phosphate ABC transporter permease PstA [Acidimicrobiales bacterium]